MSKKYLDTTLCIVNHKIEKIDSHHCDAINQSEVTKTPG